MTVVVMTKLNDAFHTVHLRRHHHHHLPPLLLWFLLLGMCAAAGGASSAEQHRHQLIANTSSINTNKKYAYVTSIYGGTPLDSVFFLGARVMMYSAKESGTTHDRVALVSDVPQSFVRTLERDGIIVKQVPKINNPYIGQGLTRWQDRFKFTLNKLYAWTLTDYDRVIMLDADVLFYENVDVLFRCGNFCIVFANPSYFHTGLMVIRPDNNTFNDMLKALANDETSYDGADQGFLNEYYSDAITQPFFLDDNLPDPDNLPRVMRLPFVYCFDHHYVYLRMAWKSAYCQTVKLITFPGQPSFKPWYWYSWPLFELSLQWHEVRVRMDPNIPVLGFGLVATLMFALTQLPLFLYRRYGRDSWHRYAEMVPLVWPLSFLVAYYLIPMATHPYLGWTMFVVYSAIFQLFFLVLYAKKLTIQPLRIWIPTLFLAFTILLLSVDALYPDSIYKWVVGALCVVVFLYLFRFPYLVYYEREKQAVEAVIQQLRMQQRQ